MVKDLHLSSGADPRLKLDPDDLRSASEHAMPQVARQGGMGEGIGIAAGVMGIAALGMVTFLSLHGSKRPAPPAAAVATPLPPKTVPVQAPPQPLAPAPYFVTPQPMVKSMPTTSVSSPVVDQAMVRAPSMIIDNSVPETTGSSASSSGVTMTPSKGLNANEQFMANANSQVTQKASKIGDPSKVVAQGAVIPAVLETAINSDLPGYTRAIVSRDIRSFDGTTVLIPRGSRLVGQYKSGLTSGETRAFIIWDRLIRPDGVSVQLASPATDDLGQAGASGSVDNHFVQRFGASILLSVVNGLASGLSKSNSTIVIGTSSDAQSVASQALQANVAIPPTIKVAQGTPIQVFAARDLDFNLGQ